MIHVILLMPTDLVVLYFLFCSTFGILLGQLFILLTGERTP